MQQSSRGRLAGDRRRRIDRLRQQSQRRPTVKKSHSLVSALLFLAAAAEAPKAPIAKKVPKSSTIHGDTRVDNYAWIRDKSNPEVIAHLEAENKYADAMMAGTAPLQKALYEETLGDVKQTDVQVT